MSGSAQPWADGQKEPIASHGEPSLFDVRKRLQQMRRIASVGFWEWDLQTGSFIASDHVYRICGLEPRQGPEPPDMVGQVVHPADAGRFEAAVAEALSGGTELDLDLRVVWPSGEIRWVNSMAEVTYDDAGHALCLVGTLADITDRKRIELSRRASELRLQVLHDLTEVSRSGLPVQQLMAAALRSLGQALDVSRCVFCHVEKDAETLRVPDDYTNGCKSLAGHLSFSAFGPTAVEVLSHGRNLVLHDVERELSAEEASAYRAAEIAAVITCPLVRSGQLHAALAVHQTTPRTWTDAEIALVQEVTERCWESIERHDAESRLLESQALLRIASRVAHMGGFRLQLPELSVTWSDEVCALHDVPAGTRPSFEQMIDYLAPEFRTLVQSSMLRCARGEAPFDLEARLVSATGRSVWVRIIGQPERSLAGAILGLHGAMQDITPRRTLEQRLLQSQKLEAVGRLAAGIAHDFNNLLTVVFGCSSLLLDELPPGAAARNEVEEIHRAAERASQLTRQLLAFGRQQLLQPRVVDWNAILEEMFSMLRRLLGDDVTIDLRLAPAIGRMRADPTQLELVVMNLLVNARDAMPSGGTLTLETANVDISAPSPDVPPGRYVVLVVSDTGVGMSAATQARIFEPFFTTKQNSQGTGLGLATVHGIVSQSGGYASVHSAIGAGSTFRIYLPRVELAPEEARPPVERSLPVRGSETVLVAEDDEHVRSIVASILRQHGYVVLEAQNAGEAFLLCEKHPGRIDLLLTDVMMPRVSGRELAERVVNMRPELQVIYMSGYTEDSTLRHGVAQSGLDFLQKPLTAEALLQRVRDVLARAAAAQGER